MQLTASYFYKKLFIEPITDANVERVMQVQKTFKTL